MPEFDEDNKIKFKDTLSFVRASKGEDDYVALLDTAIYHDDEWVRVKDERISLELTVEGSELREALDGKRVKVSITVLPPLDEWHGHKWHTKKLGYLAVFHYNDTVSNGWRWEHHHNLGSVISGRFYEEEADCKANALLHLEEHRAERRPRT